MPLGPAKALFEVPNDIDRHNYAVAAMFYGRRWRTH
jgi:hypothetical protein